MKFTELIRGVLLSISQNKFRVFLTSLGIIIGTFTIIMVVGIGKASEAAVSAQYKRLSVESITITRSRMNFSMSGTITRSFLTSDAVKMPELLDNVKSVGVSVSTSSTIAYGSTSENISVQGVNETYADITNLSLMHGDFFTDYDGEIRNRVCVLGYNVAELLFDDLEYAVGETVLIKGATFTVVGILNRIGGSGGVSGGMSSSSSADDMAFIPYDVAVKYISGSTGMMGGRVAIGGGSQTTFYALANDIASVGDAIKEIKEYIEDVTNDSASYTVTDAGSTLASALETSSTMSTLLMAVAAIVLVVSGIGIMNVLMVAVKERTREIGILKSIGAARWVILLQFLFEAVFISIIGGSLGLLLSYYAPFVLSYSSIDYLASIEGLVLGLGFSVITGIFFGFYPAFLASRLKPIDALNTD